MPRDENLTCVSSRSWKSSSSMTIAAPMRAFVPGPVLVLRRATGKLSRVGCLEYVKRDPFGGPLSLPEYSPRLPTPEGSALCTKKINKFETVEIKSFRILSTKKQSSVYTVYALQAYSSGQSFLQQILGSQEKQFTATKDHFTTPIESATPLTRPLLFARSSQPCL